MSMPSDISVIDFPAYSGGNAPADMADPIAVRIASSLLLERLTARQIKTSLLWASSLNRTQGIGFA